MTTDVRLPKTYEAKFPDKCVVCGCSSPTSTMKATAESNTFIPWRRPKDRIVVRAPACWTCSWHHHYRRALGISLSAAFMLLVLTFREFVKDWSDLSRQTMLAGCFIPQIVYEGGTDPAFDASVFREMLYYEFRDEQLALEFHELNSAEAL